MEMITATDDTIHQIVHDEIARLGPNADLNHIDVSEVTNMSYVFRNTTFKGDVSCWDVSNVTNMYGMFIRSKFNGDISCWDVSNVTNMSRMFQQSFFNRDVSRWDVSNVDDMCHMFQQSVFSGDISDWDVSNVEDVDNMFYEAPLFNVEHVRGWKLSPTTNVTAIFGEVGFTIQEMVDKKLSLRSREVDTTS